MSIQRSRMGKTAFNTNWLNTHNKVELFFFYITICIHQEPNSGQQSALSPCIQSDEKLVFVWSHTVMHSEKLRVSLLQNNWSVWELIEEIKELRPKSEQGIQIKCLITLAIPRGPEQLCCLVPNNNYTVNPKYMADELLSLCSITEKVE